MDLAIKKDVFRGNLFTPHKVTERQNIFNNLTLNGFFPTLWMQIAESGGKAMPMYDRQSKAPLGHKLFKGESTAEEFRPTLVPM